MMHFSYKRYLENQIRLTYPLEGTPIRMEARKVENKEKEKELRTLGTIADTLSLSDLRL